MNDVREPGFTLDEEKARAWLARAVALAYDGVMSAAEREGLPDIGPGYRPQEDYESGSVTGELVRKAREAGILAAAPSRVAPGHPS